MYTYFNILHRNIAVCQPITSFMTSTANSILDRGQIHKLSEIQEAQALLPKVFRKAPETSKSEVPNIVKSHQKFKSHQQEHQDDDTDEVEATDYCKKLGLPGSSHNKKVARGLAKFVRQQLGLEMVEISKSNWLMKIDLH